MNTTITKLQQQSELSKFVTIFNEFSKKKISISKPGFLKIVIAQKTVKSSPKNNFQSP